MEHLQLILLLLLEIMKFNLHPYRGVKIEYIDDYRIKIVFGCVL